jgi:hypothetical protein
MLPSECANGGAGSRAASLSAPVTTGSVAGARPGQTSSPRYVTSTDPADP